MVVSQNRGAPALRQDLGRTGCAPEGEWKAGQRSNLGALRITAKTNGAQYREFPLSQHKEHETCEPFNMCTGRPCKQEAAHPAPLHRHRLFTGTAPFREQADTD